MSYEVRTYADRVAALARVETLLAMIRGGGGQHLAAHDECDARLNEIFAFDYRQAEAGDIEAGRRVETYRSENQRLKVTGASFRLPAPPPRAPKPTASDPRDAVLSAMRASNRIGRIT